MTFLIILLSLFIGSLTGYMYGLLFVASKQRALSPSCARTTRVALIGLSMLRFAFLASFLIYLLRWDFLGSILTLTSFLVTFWLIIIRKGLTHHEGRKSS